jgi:hypothetical protein
MVRAISGLELFSLAINCQAFLLLLPGNMVGQPDGVAVPCSTASIRRWSGGGYEDKAKKTKRGGAK